MMYQKSLSGLEIKADPATGVFEGYASTFGGDPDAYGDVIVAGAFTDTLADHKAAGTSPKMLWQHDPHQPIGKWPDMSEDTKGLHVRGRLTKGVRQADEALALMQDGAVDGLSIGYRIKKYSKDEDAGVWFLEKIDLHEISVVTIGANPSARVNSVKAARTARGAIEKLKAGDRLTEREFEAVLKGSCGLSNSQAERAARVLLKGPGDPAEAETDQATRAFLNALRA